ncbi:MAG: hypothetical protein ACLGIN_07050 [Candidatus Sericytochromatia bacterium]
MERFRIETGLRPLRADGAAFHPGSGGGGSFYQGRQEQPETPEADGEAQDEAGSLESDACEFQPRMPSHLRLTTPEPEVDLEALADDLKGRVRYLTLALSHMERGIDRRMHAEVGSITVYRSA